VSYPLVIRPDAEADLSVARDWYNTQQDGLGLEFLDAIDAVFTRIQATPELYAPEYKGFRRAGLPRFPYVVYYRLREDTVEVIAVLHGSRGADLWRSRA
jgi:plasmid stabilization system protein ParE